MYVRPTHQCSNNFCKEIEESQCKTMRTFALSDEFFWKGLESRKLKNTY